MSNEADEPLAETVPLHDVAISFLARDEGIAAELSDMLEGLNVFFFPRKQEELAGTNGLESMRTPFQSARVVVVLYRDPWGKTPWTRVEQEAITDRFLKDGWEWLLFVQLDSVSALPIWLPATHVRFALEQYGITQLAGAVKMRAQQRGGKIEAPTALSRAKKMQREAALIEDERTLFRDTRWIQTEFHPRVSDLMQRIAAMADEIRTEVGVALEARPSTLGCILRDGRVSLVIGWRQAYTNAVNDQAELNVRAYNGTIFTPEERRMTFGQPEELLRMTFVPALSFGRDVRWRENETQEESVTPDDLAHRLMSIFVDLLGRANRGEITPNYM